MNEQVGAAEAIPRLPNMPADERDQWGKVPHPAEEIHFLRGPQKRSFELGKSDSIYNGYPQTTLWQKGRSPRRPRGAATWRRPSGNG
jgi:hypothetical protein